MRHTHTCPVSAPPPLRPDLTDARQETRAKVQKSPLPRGAFSLWMHANARTSNKPCKRTSDKQKPGYACRCASAHQTQGEKRPSFSSPLHTTAARQCDGPGRGFQRMCCCSKDNLPRGSADGVGSTGGVGSKRRGGLGAGARTKKTYPQTNANRDSFTSLRGRSAGAR